MKLLYVLCYLIVSYCFYIYQLAWYSRRNLDDFIEYPDILIFSLLWPFVFIGILYLSFMRQHVISLFIWHTNTVKKLLQKYYKDKYYTRD